MEINLKVEFSKEELIIIIEALKTQEFKQPNIQEGQWLNDSDYCKKIRKLRIEIQNALSIKL